MPRDERTPTHDAPPDALRRAVERIAPGVLDAPWHALRGGCTNRVWRVDRAVVDPRRHSAGTVAGLDPAGGAPTSHAEPHALVVKLCDGPATPLFPNDPAAEMAALRRLDGTGLAPRPVGAVETAAGPAIVYRHVPASGPAAPEAVARTLARLHRLAPPPGLRRSPVDAAGLRGRLAAVVRGLRAPPDALRDPPVPPLLPPVRPAFLHGDPTLGNAVGVPGGAVLIDLQCPALGDPCDDLAILLSPAMRRLDGLAPLTGPQRAAAIAAYDDPRVSARLEALAPLHRALLAAHCLWRAERGWPGAREAAVVELGALERGADEDA